MTDVLKSDPVQQDFLDDKDGHGSAKFVPCFHDPQAEWDNLGGDEELDDLWVLVLDERPDDAQTGQPQVLKGPGLARSTQAGIQI